MSSEPLRKTIITSHSFKHLSRKVGLEILSLADAFIFLSKLFVSLHSDLSNPMDQLLIQVRKVQQDKCQILLVCNVRGSFSQSITVELPSMEKMPNWLICSRLFYLCQKNQAVLPAKPLQGGGILAPQLDPRTHGVKVFAQQRCIQYHPVEFT